MRAMENIEYRFLLSELSKLVGKHFSKIYKITDGKYRLKIGDVSITIELGLRLNIAKFLEDEIEGDNFVKIVRKELENSKLLSFRQINNDRIIIFEFEHGTIVYEGFAKGNMILVRDGKTLGAVREEEWADRKIKRGIEYKYPKSNVKDKFEDTISEKYVISAMLQLPLGKEYAKEVLSRCSIDEKKSGTKLTKEEISAITKELNNIEKNLKPFGFYDKGNIIDYGLIKFSKCSSLEIKPFETLSEVIDIFYMQNKEEKNEQLEKLVRRLDEQQKRLESLREEEKILKQTGDFVYQNYEKIEKMLSLASKININEAEQKLGAYKVKVNKKEKEIEFDIS